MQTGSGHDTYLGHCLRGENGNPTRNCRRRLLRREKETWKTYKQIFRGKWKNGIEKKIDKRGTSASCRKQKRLEKNERSESEKKRKNQSEIDHQLNFVTVDFNVLRENVYFSDE